MMQGIERIEKGFKGLNIYKYIAVNCRSTKKINDRNTTENITKVKNVRKAKHEKSIY